MKQWMKAAVITTAVISLVACGNNNDNNGNNGNNGNNNMNTNQVDDNVVRPFGVTENTRNHMNNWNGRIFDYDIRDNANDRDNDTDRNDMMGMHRNNNVEASDKLADEIAKMDSIDRAMVFLTDNNAYVGVVLEEDRTRTLDADNARFGDGNNDGSDMDFGRRETSDRVTKHIKDQITQQVKTMEPEVQNVFVSANLGFIESLGDYADSLGEGRPIRGLVTEFNEMVERIFPTNTADGFDNERNSRNDMGNAMGRNIGSDSPFTTRAR